jgi:uncharacterized protein (TIGR02265 family)
MPRDVPLRSTASIVPRHARSLWEDPSLELRERLDGAPSDGLVKGWLFQSVVKTASVHGVDVAGVRRWLGIKDYSVTDYLELLAQAAVLVHPGRPARETLRVLGRGVYASFADAVLGKVVLASLGDGHHAARTGLRWVTHVYKLTSNHAVAKFTEISDRASVIHLSNVWSFPDAYHVGIFEGAAHAFGGDVGVSVESISLSEAKLTFTWRG